MPLKQTAAAPIVVKAIELTRLIPSPFEPQAHRRALSTHDEIAELGASIVENGLLHPILVRPKNDYYEIVIGESRWLASKLVNLPTIDCIVRDLTDAKAKILQYEENHRRRNNTPMIDALYFKDLRDIEGYTEQEIADQLNTTKENVIDKLTLNDLILEAVRELESRSLYLKHAYYLARHPAATQKEIVDLRLAYRDHDREKKCVSFGEFKSRVNTIIHRRLKTAPFDTLDPRLHIKNLTCDVCPERTGYKTKLFPDLTDDDSCLNPKCFRLKSDTHLKLQREAIAARMPNVENKSVREIAKSVPIVTEQPYAPAHTAAFKDKVTTNVHPLSKPECEYSEESVVVRNDGQSVTAYSCRNEDCEIHYPKPKKPIAEELSDDERERLWADFNRKIFSVVREQILMTATESFTDNTPLWIYDNLIQKLIVEFWWMSPIETKEVVHRILGEWKGVPTVRSPYLDIKRFVESLDKRGQSQILFLLLNAGQFAHRFETDAVEDWLENLAADYTKLNYHRLDAEARYELAPEEFKPEANLYLQYIRNGHLGAELPVFWIEKPEAGEEEV